MTDAVGMHPNEREIRRWETAVQELALDAYRAFVTRARPLVLPSLTASALDDLPPDPAQISDAGWDDAIADTLLAGLGVLYAARVAQAWAARGVTMPAAPAVVGAVTIPLPTGARPLVTDVAAARPGLLAGQAVDVIVIVHENRFQADIAEHLRDVANRTKDLPDEVFRAITADLADGTARGESAQQLRDRVRDYLDMDSEGGRTRWLARAERIARTEVTAAFNSATLRAAHAEADLFDVQLEKVWIASMDARTRKSHFAADGQRVALDAEFRVGGKRLRFPGDPRGPAEEVINCRCSFSYIDTDDDLPAETDRQTERERSNGTRRDPGAEVRRRADDGVTRARDDPDGVGIVAAADPEGASMSRRTWAGTLAPIGKPTGDGRVFAADIALAFREFPLPLMWQKATDIGHDKSVIVGRIDTASIVDGQIAADGVWFDSDEAAEAAILLEEGVIRPSVDLCDVEWTIVDSDGREIPEDALMEAFERGEQIDALECTTSATLMGATMVAKPAFAEARIEFTGAADPAEDDDLVAAGVSPWLGRAAWFDDPELSALTPLTVTPDGRVFGHLAGWDTEHVGLALIGKRQRPPRSATNYAYFHVSAIGTDRGLLSVGRLTIGGGHAASGLGLHAAAEHYDNVGSSWAYVRAGEDAFGIWVAGQVHPAATAEQVREGSATPLSGDWRKVGGNLELVAALGVVSGGFPIPRGAQDEAGRDLSLVAAGAIPLMPRGGRVIRRGMEQLAQSAADRAVATYVAREKRRRVADELAARVRVSKARALAAKVRR